MLPLGTNLVNFSKKESKKLIPTILGEEGERKFQEQKEQSNNLKRNIYIYIYIYMCVCVCESLFFIPKYKTDEYNELEQATEPSFLVFYVYAMKSNDETKAAVSLSLPV